MWVVVGLGNPGRRYRATRHNVGFRVVDRLAARWDVAVEREAHRALVGEARRAGERVLLVKPQTWMNESGEALASLARFYRVDPARVIAVHDDVDLEPGRVRIRRGGRAGGNRGVESLMAALGDPGFLRVKIGVGRPPAGPVPPSWVLSVPPAEELAALAAAEERAADAVELLVTDGPERAMNRINQKEVPHGGPPL
ncbi:MAG TPA: aminoacyl-tRNA hydrolase [Candidatus Elarobacter sp.]|nr:aminoacyl-tRNA hydrolase [Candidatus Elarobacter sp.]